jgi:dienelactone hydrolase
MSESGWRGNRWLAVMFGGLLLSFLALLVLTLATLLFGAVFVNVYLASNLSPREVPISQPTAVPIPPVTAAVTPTPTPSPTRVSVAEPRATLAALATQVAVLSQETVPPPVAESLPAKPAIPIAPAPISHPMAGYTIDGLQARSYPGGAVQVRSVLTTTRTFTRYYIEYPSDDLTITGIMQVPPGEGPFPVIVLNHGYIPRNRYWSGADTWSAAEYLNRRGYLTIAPDFRSWGESDVGDSFFSTGQVIDALNLISSLSSIPEADSSRVGMWGHSMGGGVTTKAITIDPRIKAAVLYAPVSADDAQVLARWGTGCKGGGPEELDQDCAGAEVLTSSVDQSLYLAYLEVASNPQFLYQMSPINYLEWVMAPVQIHVGTADTRTPPTWSAAIHQALQNTGKEVEYFTYTGQGHSFEGEHWRLFMERVADFYDRHLYPVTDPTQTP